MHAILVRKRGIGFVDELVKSERCDVLAFGLADRGGQQVTRLALPANGTVGAVQCRGSTHGCGVRFETRIFGAPASCRL